jgi:hypothetical protein
MWILSYLPNWIFYATAVSGLLGVVSSYVLGMLPLVNRYKLPLQVVSIVIIAISTCILLE